MSDYAYALFTSRNPLPISTGEVLDKLWRTLRGNWKLYLALGAPVAVLGIAWIAVILAVVFATSGFSLHPGVQPDPMRIMPWLFAAMAIGTIPNLLVFALYQAAAAFATLKAAGGQKPTMREAYAAAWSRTTHYCWLMILQYLCAAGPILVLWALIGGLMALQAGHLPQSPAMFLMIPLVVLVYLGAFVYAIFAMLYLGMAFPASVAENLSAVAALKRSAKLSYRVKGKLFLVLLVVYALSYAAIFVLEIGGGILFAAGTLAFEALHLSTAVGIAAGAIAGLAVLVLLFAWTALMWAAYSISFTIVYCDQRLRLDGAAGGFGQAQPEAPLA